MNRFHTLDWKVLFLALLGCYIIPWLVVGTLVSSMVDVDVIGISGWKRALVNSYPVVCFVAMPFAAGCFTARFSKSRPRLHVLLVVLLAGLAFNTWVSSSSWAAQAFVLALSMAAAFLGAFVALRNASPR